MSHQPPDASPEADPSDLPGDLHDPTPARPDRILALDIGDARIGVSITDPLNILATPLLTIFRKTPNVDLKSIARLIRRYEITDLVLGDPVHLSGEPSAQTRKTRAFADQIEAGHPGLRLHRLDERLTTSAAHELLNQTGKRVQSKADRIARERTVDQVAAVLLLQGFLSLRSPVLLPPPPDL